VNFENVANIDSIFNSFLADVKKDIP